MEISIGIRSNLVTILDRSNRGFHIIQLRLCSEQFFSCLSSSFFGHVRKILSFPLKVRVRNSMITKREVINYFQEIALGFEFGSASKITRKWTDTMRIFVGGQGSDDLLLELDQIMNEINTLATDGFFISKVPDSLSSNYYIFLGSADEYAAMYPSLSNLVKTNWGLFSIRYNGAGQLYRGYMYVDIHRADQIEQRHLLREELTQSLGLGNDSSKYTESIFQTKWTRTNAYSDIDRELIRLLYHPDMPIGLERSQVSEVLSEILINE